LGPDSTASDAGEDLDAETIAMYNSKVAQSRWAQDDQFVDEEDQAAKSAPPEFARGTRAPKMSPGRLSNASTARYLELMLLQLPDRISQLTFQL